MILSALLTFASGAAIEIACVFWVHYSERGAALKTGVASMVIGTAQCLGIGEYVRDWRLAPFFVLGYGVGTAAAVRFKSARMPPSPLKEGR